MTDRLSLPKLSGPFHLSLKIISAALNHNSQQQGKSIDPYVVVEFTRGASSQVTKHTKRIKGPGIEGIHRETTEWDWDWECEFYFGGEIYEKIGFHHDTIKLLLMDKDISTSNVVGTTAVMDLKQLAQGSDKGAINKEVELLNSEEEPVGKLNIDI